MSIATENFIKIIYLFGQNKAFDTKPGSIAKALGISNAAATDMARKLADKELIQYEKYQPLELTSEGKKMALNIIRRHRLWETFLYKTFQLSLHEIHKEAESLEHLTSDFLIEKISSFLGHPKFDPHGDPIPKANGSISPGKDQISLSMAEPGHKYKVTRLFSSESEFFNFCNSNKINPGSIIRVENQYIKNKMTEIIIDTNKILLNADFSNIIYVKQIIKDK